MEEDEDIEVREMIIWALGRIGGDKARRVLEVCLESDEETLVLAAEESLDELNIFDNGLILYDFADSDDDDDLLEIEDFEDLYTDGKGHYLN